jgi:GNAT superfamily N-acetyltransferase
VLNVDRATVEDVEVISQILGEIESYYGGKEVPGDPGKIKTALFSDRPAATVLLARDRDQVLGLASFSLLWPAAGADTSLYLKELYVRAQSRRHGVGRALMAAVRDAATAAGCRRVEWTADRDNPPALDFYAAMDFVEHAGKVHYRWEQ